MSTRAPAAYQALLEQLAKLPGVGRRSAERIALHLLKKPDAESFALAAALRAFREELVVCSVTGMVADADPCWIVTDPKRDHTRILVVEQPADVLAFEQSNAWNGSYHVLLGRLSPMEAVSPGDLNIGLLLDRVRAGGRGPSGGTAGNDDGPRIRIEEVVLATSPSLEGDGTALYLEQELAGLGVSVTRVARGLSAGQALDTASKAVLGDALHHRVPTR
ncbi:recombination mediator RecR [Phycisphaera mikurensis]|uniref:Recombination protein RecR n=1 Tax=Phycisphaera mikurensis (strain NBRC 102666 / KCTC 22515 / FYK2301M01) TaxID=1142394 RepID=I0IHN8_PHYMF|nr:toprim domain-containing protein [Phycisphaera mikurensis]MBB6441021.1 recombination protein RecR [Phycisphaera mikurensis]BAM04776.1 recombination protein RecR [Phycisphaera mikurensis NBRC 102666]